MDDRLPDKLESNARIEWRIDGVEIGTRRIVDFDTSGGWTAVDDGGLDDKVTITPAGGGDSLWEETSGDLHPIAEPATSFTTTVGDSNIYVDTDDLVLTSGTGTNLVNWDLNGSTGDLNCRVGNDWNVAPPGGQTNQDWNVDFDRDFNLDLGRNWNVIVGDQWTVNAEGGASRFRTGNTHDFQFNDNSTSDAGQGISINLVDGASDYSELQWFVQGAAANAAITLIDDNAGLRTFEISAGGTGLDYLSIESALIKIGSVNLAGSGEVVIEAYTAAPPDADLHNGSISFYLDESGNNLKVKAKYSDGTVKTGTVALT